MKRWFYSVMAAAAAVSGCAASASLSGGDSPGPSNSASVRPRTFEFASETTPPTSASASPSVAPPPVLDKDSVRQSIRERYTELRACYEKELKKRPHLHGTVVCRFMISDDGTVASVDMSSSKLPSKPVTECVGKIFQSMKFPAPPNGMVLITYPLDFMPEVTTDWQ